MVQLHSKHPLNCACNIISKNNIDIILTEDIDRSKMLG